MNPLALSWFAVSLSVEYGRVGENPHGDCIGQVDFMSKKLVHFQYHKVQTVQGSKYGIVPSNTVQLADLDSDRRTVGRPGPTVVQLADLVRPSYSWQTCVERPLAYSSRALYKSTYLRSHEVKGETLP